MKENILISIKSSENIAENVSKMDFEQVLISEPIGLTSPSDVLDAPLNPDDIVQGVEVVKVMFQAGSAILTFCTAMIKLLKENKATAQISTQEGEKQIDGNTKPEELEKMIKK